MKKVYFIILVTFVGCQISFAQNLPDWVQPNPWIPGSGGINNTIPGTITNAIIPMSAYNSGVNTTPTLFNYIRTWHPLTRTTNEAGITESSDPLYFPMSTNYVNGFGQTIETINRYNNTSDSSSIIFNDNRPIPAHYSFLPYAVAGDARFQMDPFFDQGGFYAARFPQDAGTAASEAIHYSDANTRQTLSYLPGKSNIGQTRGVTTVLGTNQATDVQIWGINSSPPNYPQMNGNYTANQLFEKITTNADGAQLLQFYDLDNKLICEKQLTSINQYSITYYVYDIYDRLTYILTPKAMNYLAANSWIPTSTIINNLCYNKQYDVFGRVVQTHTPGKTSNDCTVYDQYDRPVLTQSPQLASLGQWKFTLYDPLSREISSGILTNGWNQSFFQHVIDNPGTYPFTTLPQLGYYMVTPSVEGTYVTSFPSTQINSYKYYDNYNFLTTYPALPSAANTTPFSSLPSTPYSIAPVFARNTKGFLTGTAIRILKPFAITGVNDWVATANYYDDYNRILQVQSLNHKNGLDFITNQYDFQGNKTQEVINHNNPTSSATPSTNIITSHNTYSTTNKLNTVNFSINGIAMPQVSSLSYNSLGQVIHKNIGGVEDQVYNYNIRSQLTGINADYAEWGNADGNICSFGESIKYNCGFTGHVYNGNISGIYWKGAGSSPERSYAYTYDLAGRLLNGDFKELINAPYYSLPGGGFGGGPSWTNSINDYSERNITYDPNGNIKTLQRFGPLTTKPGMIDNLTYTYQNTDQSNALQFVSDGVPSTATTAIPYDFKDISGSTDYSYSDGDGNMTTDANKKTTTTYNYLNLPVTINFSSPVGDNINYVYDANGNKLISIINTAASGTTTTDYIGNFQYQNNTLNMITNPEGYTHSDATGLNSFFYVKDHLGNVRNVMKAIPVTEPPMQYFASHELVSAAMERLVFQNLDSVRDYKPLAPGGSDQYAARLDGSDPNKTVGTAILLNVMAGDRFDLAAQCYYDVNNPSMATVQPPQILNAIISTLNGGTIVNNQEGNISQIIPSIFSPANYMGIYDSIISVNTDSSIPQAYLNYLAFDENFNIVPGNCGAIQIGATPGTWNVIGTPAPITISRDGYFTAYISTRMANLPVYFDAIGITHYSGGLVQENQYYPYGLPVNVAQVDPTNKYLYQTKELNTTDNLYLSDFSVRQYDAQLGRFTSLDPMNQFNSGYVGMGNRPTSTIDPTGMLDGDGDGDGDGYGDGYGNGNDNGGGDNNGGNRSNIVPFLSDIGGSGNSGGNSDDILRTFTQNVGNSPANFSYYADPVTHNATSDIIGTLPVVNISGKKDYLLDEDPDVLKKYSPFIPDATGIQINGNLAMGAGGSFTLGIGQVDNHFGVWFTLAPTVGTPDASIGLSLMMAEHEHAGPVPISSWSGRGDNYTGSVSIVNGSYGHSVGDQGEHVWNIYGAGVNLATHDFSPIPVGIQANPVTYTWSWWAN